MSFAYRALPDTMSPLSASFFIDSRITVNEEGVCSGQGRVVPCFGHLH